MDEFEIRLYQLQKKMEWLIDGYGTNLLLANGLGGIPVKRITELWNVEIERFTPPEAWCKHTKVTDIGYTGSLPRITGFDHKYYDGFCTECERTVYAQTRNNIPYIRWTLDRYKAWSDD